MSKTIKIKVPFFIDHPFAGRYSSPIPLGFHDFITGEEGTLRYNPSILSPNPKKSFQKKLIEKILFIEKNISIWTKEGKIEPLGKGDAKFVLYLVDVHGKRHELIPSFSMNFRQKKREHFLNELSQFTDLK